MKKFWNWYKGWGVFVCLLALAIIICGASYFSILRWGVAGVMGWELKTAAILISLVSNIGVVLFAGEGCKGAKNETFKFLVLLALYIILVAMGFYFMGFLLF